jgi:hypothetical protein
MIRNPVYQDPALVKPLCGRQFFVAIGTFPVFLGSRHRCLVNLIFKIDHGVHRRRHKRLGAHRLSFLRRKSRPGSCPDPHSAAFRTVSTAQSHSTRSISHAPRGSWTRRPNKFPIVVQPRPEEQGCHRLSGYLVIPATPDLKPLFIECRGSRLAKPRPVLHLLAECFGSVAAARACKVRR